MKEYPLENIIDQYILGDCLEILPLIPDNIFDLIIIDPPYFIPAKHYNTRKDFKKSFGDLGILEFFFKNVFTQIERVLKDTGFFYVFCNEDSYPLFWYYSFFFTKKVRALAWNKILSINGYHWRHQHEMILFGIMPNSPKIKTGDGDVLNGRAVPKDKRTHPAEKPLELIDKLILKSSKEGFLIGDFFAGSGVVLKEAKKLKRYYFGIEFDRGYYEQSKKEIDSIKSQLSPEYSKKLSSTIDRFIKL